MERSSKDQRGIAMVVEVVLVGLVLIVIGYAVVASRNAHKSADSTKAANVGAPSTVANGSVDNVANALNLDASSDSTASAQEGSYVPDSGTASAQSMEGSYDENSF